MSLRTALLVALLGWVAVAFGQLPTGLPQVKPGPASPSGFVSARAVLDNLIESVKDGDYDAARQSLDLSRLNFALRENEGRRRVQMLVAILNRIDGFLLEEMSDHADRDRVRIPVRTSKESFAVGQIELVPDSSGGWLVSSETVDALPDVWHAVRDQPPINNLPSRFEGEIDLSQRLRARFGSAWWKEVLGLELWQWLGLAVLAVTGLVLPRLAASAVRSKPVLRKRFVVGTTWIAVSLIWQVALLVFDLPTALHITALLLARIVAAVAAIIVGISVIDSVLRAASQRTTGLGRRADSIFFPILRNFVRFLWIVVILVGFLSSLDINVTGIVAGLGIGGLVLALAAKDSVENVFGSVTILFDMPFGIGDWVKIGEVNGIVEEINLRSTRIRTFSDSVITLPNSNLTKAAVENYGARRRRRVDMPFEVGHANDLAAVIAMCDDVRTYMESADRVAPDSAYVYVTAVSDTAVKVTVQGYILTDDYREELETRQALVAKILEVARERGVHLGPHTVPMPTG
jgi:MscS family membrane protein